MKKGMQAQKGLSTETVQGRLIKIKLPKSYPNMHVNQKCIRKSQAKATMQAFKRHVSHNKEQRVAQILTQGKTIQKQLDMQREIKNISPQNN